MRSLFSLITLFDMPLAAIVFLEHSLPIPFEVSFNKMKKKKPWKKKRENLATAFNDSIANQCNSWVILKLSKFSYQRVLSDPLRVH